MSNLQATISNLKCPKCGATAQVAAGQKPVCGKCGFGAPPGWGGNELNNSGAPSAPEGRDVNVDTTEIRAQVGVGERVFEIALWTAGPIIGLIALLAGAVSIAGGLGIMALGTLPGLIFMFMKKGALEYFRKLQQKIQAHASEIGNFEQQRVVILQNLVPLVAKAVDLDKDVMKSVAAFRGGANPTAGANPGQVHSQLDGIFGRINVAFEAYPQLQAHAQIADAMRQNSYLQKEITAAMTLYNDAVQMWNQDIFAWPTKIIVAARQGYTTKIPFVVSAQMRSAARGTFF